MAGYQQTPSYSLVSGTPMYFVSPYYADNFTVDVKCSIAAGFIPPPAREDVWLPRSLGR